MRKIKREKERGERIEKRGSKQGRKSERDGELGIDENNVIIWKRMALYFLDYQLWMIWQLCVIVSSLAYSLLVFKR